MGWWGIWGGSCGGGDEEKKKLNTEDTEGPRRAQRRGERRFCAEVGIETQRARRRREKRGKEKPAPLKTKGAAPRCWGLAAGYGAYYQEGFGAGGYFEGERGVGGFVGEIFGAGEEAEEGAALKGVVIANGAAEHGVAGFEGVEDGSLGDGTDDFQADLAAHVSKRAKMRRKFNADHGSVCTSTDKTAGRSRTIGNHESPALEEAYTWPPEVPK